MLADLWNSTVFEIGGCFRECQAACALLGRFAALEIAERLIKRFHSAAPTEAQVK